MGANRTTKSQGEKRPANCWLLFRTEILQILKEIRESGIANPFFDYLWTFVPEERKEKVKHLLHLPDFKKQQTVSALISAVWANAPESVKEHYKQLQKDVKDTHTERYPHYKFEPKSKTQKMKERQERAQRRKEERENKKWAENSISVEIPTFERTIAQDQFGTSSYYDFDFGFWVVPSAEPPAFVPEIDYSTLDFSNAFDFINHWDVASESSLSNALSNVDYIQPPAPVEVESLYVYS